VFPEERDAACLNEGRHADLDDARLSRRATAYLLMVWGGRCVAVHKLRTGRKVALGGGAGGVERNGTTSRALFVVSMPRGPAQPMNLVDAVEGIVPKRIPVRTKISCADTLRLMLPTKEIEGRSWIVSYR